MNFDTYLFSLLVAKIKNKAIVYDIFDFYGDVLPSFLRNIVVTLDKYLLPYSNALILADDSRIEQIGEKSTVTFIPLTIVPQRIFLMVKIWIIRVMNL